MSEEWTAENYSARATAEFERQAVAIGDRILGLKVGFDPITILTLIPVIIQGIQYLIAAFKKCREPDPVPPTPQEYVNRLYKNGRYHRKLLNKVEDDLWQAVRDENKKRKKARKELVKVTNRQVSSAAVATLDQIREADNRVVGVCLKG